MSERAEPGDGADEPPTPVAPIPLPPDPLGRWLGPTGEADGADEPGTEPPADP